MGGDATLITNPLSQRLSLESWKPSGLFSRQTVSGFRLATMLVFCSLPAALDLLPICHAIAQNSEALRHLLAESREVAGFSFGGTYVAL